MSKKKRTGNNKKYEGYENKWEYQGEIVPIHLNVIILMGIFMVDKNIKQIKAEPDVGSIFHI